MAELHSPSHIALHPNSEENLITNMAIKNRMTLYMFLMRDEKEERKKEASKVKQTNKAKQHSTPKAVTFPRKK